MQATDNKREKQAWREGVSIKSWGSGVPTLIIKRSIRTMVSSLLSLFNFFIDSPLNTAQDLTFDTCDCQLRYLLYILCFYTPEATSGPLNSKHAHILLTRFPWLINGKLEYTPPNSLSCTNSTFQFGDVCWEIFYFFISWNLFLMFSIK